MKYTLKRPCADCPFRADIQPFLHPGRVEEIQDVLAVGGTFACHKTVDYDKTDEDGEPLPGKGEHFCAGALILMEKEYADNGGCAYNQQVRFAMRFGLFNPDTLDMTAPVFESFEAMLEAQERR